MKSKRLLYTLEVVLGILLMGGVLLIAAHADLRNAQRTLSSSASYIKEQCNQYQRLNFASETKSVMRMIESVHQINHTLTEHFCSSGSENEESLEKMLEECAKDSYVTGIILLDGNGIIIVYYHTTLEYTQAFHLSVDTLLSGYNLEQDGTFVVSSGKQIVASNDEELIGKSTDDLEILRKIKNTAESDRIVQAKSESGVLSREYGLMEHGRDYYVYAYLPEKEVFVNTIPSVLFALIIYVIILVVIHMIRWKTEQNYREEQLRTQRQYNEQLEIKNEQLKEAVNQADCASMAKTNFLSRMSHDIRTPLNGIIGLLEIGERHPNDAKMLKENQKKMKISANHLLSLINDILQMSKLESGEVVLSEEPMDLKVLSDDVLTIMEQRAAEAGVTMKYDRDEEWWKWHNVYGSPLHIRQIFLNVYSNCIKYNHVGGEVQTSCKCLEMKQGIVTYQWTIRDTGVGMSQTFVQHIFDPFVQEHYDARSVYHGTGLGMAIVKKLIDKMNGMIEVKSEEGVGSTFVITLPFRLALEQSEEEQQQERENLTDRASIDGCRLLLAEDNALNAEIAETLLQDQGALVTVVADGQQAVDRFASEPPGSFDAILMDVMMPVMDGLTATRKIREMSRADAKTMPIIAMTANAYDEDIRQCLDAGMNAHLAKPLQMNQVVAAIAKYCN